MASAGSNSDLEDVLKTYVERAATDGMLKLTPVVKCFDAAKLSKYKTVLESSVWAKHQTPAKKCTVKQVSTVVIDDVASFFVGKSAKVKGPQAPADHADVIAACAEIRSAIAALKTAKKATAKVDSTTARLTDTAGYTGSHKERFDADGKGKGADGRTDKADGSGYVGNYKGEGTFKK